MTGIQRAVEQAAGAAKLGLALGVSHQAVYVWVKRGWVPTERAAQIEDLYGVPRASLVNPNLLRAIGATASPDQN